MKRPTERGRLSYARTVPQLTARTARDVGFMLDSAASATGEGSGVGDCHHDESTSATVRAPAGTAGPRAHRLGGVSRGRGSRRNLGRQRAPVPIRNRGLPGALRWHPAPSRERSASSIGTRPSSHREPSRDPGRRPPSQGRRSSMWNESSPTIFAVQAPGRGSGYACASTPDGIAERPPRTISGASPR